MWPKIVLWLFTIDLGIAFGAGLYEARIVLPQWQSLPPQEWTNTGIAFWVYVTTVPLTLLTLASLAAALRTRGPMRGWYLAAVCIVLLERAATFSYFIPTIVHLTSTQGLPSEQVAATLSQWSHLNYGRHLLSLAGWLAALRALSLSALRSG
jgi:hypothetical protein